PDHSFRRRFRRLACHTSRAGCGALVSVPALRDQFGQSWPFPPIAGPDQPGWNRTWLIFIPGAYTPVCMSELAAVPELAEALSNEHVGVRLIAPDAAPVLRMVADHIELICPLLTDFLPQGAAAIYYGVFDEASGRPRRTCVLVDRSGALLTSLVSTRGSRKMGDPLTVLYNEKQ